MSEEKKCEPGEGKNRQAMEVLKALSHFEFPAEVSEVEDWLVRTKPLQSFVRKSCENDKSGKVTLDCVHVLFDLMAANGDAVSPAVWDILSVVDESEVDFLVEKFFKYSSTKLKNILCALVNGVCQCGHRVPQIRTWCFAFIKGLEDRQKYSIVRRVSEALLLKFVHGLMLPHTRKQIYPLFERILYPMTHPTVFNLIVNRIPEMLDVLEVDQEEDMRKIFESFCGLVATLADRFSPTSWKEGSYKKLKAALSKYPENTYKLSSVHQTWYPKQKNTTKVSNLLECPVCYDRFVTPIVACENGHCICSTCKDKLKNCPICRAHFSNIRMTLMDQIMEITEFPCKNFDSGCDAVMLYRDIWDHELDCEYRIISCDIVAFDSNPKLICKEDVIVANFHKHIEQCHKSFVTGFELNSERRVELWKKRANEVRLLRNAASSLYFIERIYVTEDEVFFSYHYIGKSSDAKNYVYTIKINGNGIPQKIQYSNFCLPNYKGVFDTEVDKRCFILKPEKVFDARQTKFEYSVKIEDVNAYRLRLKKNKFMVSI